MYLEYYDDHRHIPFMMVPSIDGEFIPPQYAQNKYSPKLVPDRTMEIQTTLDYTNDRAPISASSANGTVRAQNTSSIENNKKNIPSNDEITQSRLLKPNKIILPMMHDPHGSGRFRHNK
jgi:hypothetical protein